MSNAASELSRYRTCGSSTASNPRRTCARAVRSASRYATTPSHHVISARTRGVARESVRNSTGRHSSMTSRGSASSSAPVTASLYASIRVAGVSSLATAAAAASSAADHDPIPANARAFTPNAALSSSGRLVNSITRSMTGTAPSAEGTQNAAIRGSPTSRANSMPRRARLSICPFVSSNSSACAATCARLTVKKSAP